ncbi:MAG: ABC-2 family transporter protein [Deltaproteobacteria bacterium]|nr:ABC-2 family transporter protein [Deltaproteobacteria bacterium]
MYFAQFLKARLEYKVDFFATLFSSIVTALTGLLFIVFLMDNKTIAELNGWSRDEVLFIYGYAQIPTALFLTVSQNLYSFGDRYVVQGQFDKVLVRPLNSLFQILFESFNMEVLGNLVLGILVMAYANRGVGFSFGVTDILWLLVSSVSGALILISVFVVLASLSFHFEDKMGVAAPFYNLMHMARYPLPIFNRAIQLILSWVVPFGFVAFYPATHFFKKEGFAVYCYLTPLMAVACMFVAGISWKYGVSKYSSAGN